MKHFTALLQELDRLYYSDSMDEYKQSLEKFVEQVEQTIPGFTIALAEIYTVGSERNVRGGMRHVLLPTLRTRNGYAALVGPSTPRFSNLHLSAIWLDAFLPKRVDRQRRRCPSTFGLLVSSAKATIALQGRISSASSPCLALSLFHLC